MFFSLCPMRQQYTLLVMFFLQNMLYLNKFSCFCLVVAGVPRGLLLVAPVSIHLPFSCFCFCNGSKHFVQNVFCFMDVFECVISHIYDLSEQRAVSI